MSDIEFKNKFQDKYSKYFSWEQPTGKDLMNIVVATENLLMLKQAFDKYGLGFWLVFGTALGAYRDGGFIPYDLDTDVAIFHNDIDKLFDITDLLIEKELMPLRTFSMPDIGFKDSKDIISGISYGKGGEYIDVYFFKKVDDKYRCLLYWAELHQFDKLDMIGFLNKIFRVPSDTENYFVGRYGKDWKIPTKGINAAN